MNQLIRFLLGLFVFLTSTLPVAYSQSLPLISAKKTVRDDSIPQLHRHDRLIEEFSFLIKDLKVDHQTEINNLNISISYRYVADIANADYPDFRLLAKDVEMFLMNYPNEKDYWEVLNKQMTLLLLKKYPAIKRITSEFRVDPSRLDPYTRSSCVTRERPVFRSNRKRI